MAPATEVIDGSGRHVYPGLISSSTDIGLVEIEAVRASLDMAEIGRVNPNVRAEVAVNPESELIPVLRANGIALAVSAPSGGLDFRYLGHADDGRMDLGGYDAEGSTCAVRELAVNAGHRGGHG